MNYSIFSPGLNWLTPAGEICPVRQSICLLENIGTHHQPSANERTHTSSAAVGHWLNLLKSSYLDIVILLYSHQCWPPKCEYLEPVAAYYPYWLIFPVYHTTLRRLSAGCYVYYVYIYIYIYIYMQSYTSLVHNGGNITKWVCLKWLSYFMFIANERFH